MEITVDTVTGRNITLKFENPELVKDVNIRVKTEMLIFVETTSGEKLKLKMQRTHTVDKLKQAIVKKKKNISFIGGNSLQYLGKNLQDSKTLADYDIKEGSTLKVVTNPTIPNMQLHQQQQQVVTNPIANPTIPNMQQPHQLQQQVVTNPTIAYPTIPMQQPHQQKQQVVTNPTFANPTIPNIQLQQQQQQFNQQLLQLQQQFKQQVLQLQQQQSQAVASMNAKTSS